MSEKPGKRLASKGRYAWLMTARAILVLVLIPVSLVLAYSILGLLVNVFNMSDPDSIGNCILFAIGISATCFSIRSIIREEKKIERVVPITKRTTSSLPPEETLVRASDLPPSHQQAELLRAAQAGQETSREELLRATSTTGRDA